MYRNRTIFLPFWKTTYCWKSQQALDFISTWKLLFSLFGYIYSQPKNSGSLDQSYNKLDYLAPKNKYFQTLVNVVLCKISDQIIQLLLSFGPIADLFLPEVADFSTCCYAFLIANCWSWPVPALIQAIKSPMDLITWSSRSIILYLVWIRIHRLCIILNISFFLSWMNLLMLDHNQVFFSILWYKTFGQFLPKTFSKNVEFYNIKKL
jgi:hypothetical protein